jgi:predicted N-acyltransferase
MAIRLHRHAHIDDFSPDEWDGLLSGGSFYGSHSWLKAVEHHDTFQASYLTARDDEGALLGALPLYTTPRAPAESRFDPAVLFQDAVTGNFFPATIVGLRAGYSTEFPVDSQLPGDVADAVLTSLVLAGVQIARDNRGSFSFLYVKPAAAARLAGVGGLPSCQIFSEPYATLKVRWDDFGGYLASHSAGRRHGIKQDVAAFERSGCELSYAPLSDCYAECVPLSAAVQSRYGAMDSAAEIEERLAAQAAAMGDAALCILCRHKGNLVGFSLLYRWRDELYARIVGFDYERLPADSRVYFTVLFYEPIRYAIARGIKVIDYGVEVGEAKVARGCVLSPRWSVTYNSPGCDAQDAASRKNLAAREGMAARYGRYSGALPAAQWSPAAWAELGAIDKVNAEG